jgi:hypothetical protein
MNRIVVAYSGVHQSYQILLAAEELVELDRFYCSIFDAPGKWGGWRERFRALPSCFQTGLARTRIGWSRLLPAKYFRTGTRPNIGFSHQAVCTGQKLASRLAVFGQDQSRSAY